MDNEATGVRMSWQALGGLVIAMLAVGGGIAAIQIQQASLNQRMVELSADILEVRGEVRAVNTKIERYIDLLVEEKNGVSTGSSTARRRSL